MTSIGTIESIVDALKKEHSTDKGLDLKSICREHGIRIIQSEQVGGGYATATGEWGYILHPRYLFDYVREFAIAHELGHHVLGLESSESQANLFASMLTGKNYCTYLGLSAIDVTYHLLTNPVPIIKFSLNTEDVHKMASELDSEWNTFIGKPDLPFQIFIGKEKPYYAPVA